jgi:RNA polymerase sigma factor (sigma-70 family)
MEEEGGTAVARRARLNVGGTWVEEDQFLDDLRSGDLSASRRLIRQIKDDRKQGGSDGLVLLSKAYRARIVAFQARILNGNLDAAGEAWNDALLDIWNGIENYDPRLSKFRTWVYNLARYQALARKRRMVRDQRMPLIDPSADEDQLLATFDLPEPPTAADRQALQRAFRRLGSIQRQLLWHRYVEGWMPTEIIREGLVEGISEKSVRVYINRAAARLRELFENELANDRNERN